MKNKVSDIEKKGKYFFFEKKTFQRNLFYTRMIKLSKVSIDLNVGKVYTSLVDLETLY